MKTPAKRLQAAGGEVDATRAVVSHPRRQTIVLPGDDGEGR
jgi:hypothetical protein